MGSVSSLFLDLKLTTCLSLCRNLDSVLSLLRFQNDQDADYLC